MTEWAKKNCWWTTKRPNQNDNKAFSIEMEINDGVVVWFTKYMQSLEWGWLTIFFVFFFILCDNLLQPIWSSWLEINNNMFTCLSRTQKSSRKSRQDDSRWITMENFDKFFLCSNVVVGVVVCFVLFDFMRQWIYAASQHIHISLLYQIRCVSVCLCDVPLFVQFYLCKALWYQPVMFFPSFPIYFRLIESAQ